MTNEMEKPAEPTNQISTGVLDETARARYEELFLELTRDEQLEEQEINRIIAQQTLDENPILNDMF